MSSSYDDAEGEAVGMVSGRQAAEQGGYRLLGGLSGRGASAALAALAAAAALLAVANLILVGSLSGGDGGGLGGGGPAGPGHEFAVSFPAAARGDALDGRLLVLLSRQATPEPRAQVGLADGGTPRQLSHSMFVCSCPLPIVYFIRHFPYTKRKGLHKSESTTLVRSASCRPTRLWPSSARTSTAWPRISSWCSGLLAIPQVRSISRV